jgi:predicted HAD superfamily Cof-like phosphohydrolase
MAEKTLTNFEMVGEFHETFGHPKPAKLDKNILVEKPDLCKFRLSLIEEEFKELKEACENNDMREVVDGLSDILYVVYGMGQAFGINLDDAFRRVHTSNMSKVCDTEAEALETIEYYKTLPGFETTRVGYRVSPDGKRFVVYNEDTSKILKSKWFSEPDIDPMLK